MEPLDDYFEQSQRQSQEEFVRNNPNPFLVYHRDPEANEGLMPMQSFRTATVSTRALENTKPVPRSHQSYRVQVIQKTPQSPWPDRISIGRARNNDVVVRDTSVSKLHAYMRAEGGTFSIADALSRNGITLNGTLIPAEKDAPLASGDTLILGSVEAKFLSTEDFYHFLKDLA